MENGAFDKVTERNMYVVVSYKYKNQDPQGLFLVRSSMRVWDLDIKQRHRESTRTDWKAISKKTIESVLNWEKIKAGVPGNG